MSFLGARIRRAMAGPRTLLLLFLCPLACCLRCWICGEDATPHVTNPAQQNASKGQLTKAWCSASITHAQCIETTPGRQLQCYKELWTVDGASLVQRGCSVRDERYNRTGCEEQITGAANFKVVLCLCNGDMCNEGRMAAPNQMGILASVFIASLMYPNRKSNC